MITMTEINSLLKENFTKQLQDIKSLPENLANGYKTWVQGLVQAAEQDLQMESSEQQDAPTKDEGAA